jgi:hypothetical protein
VDPQYSSGSAALNHILRSSKHFVSTISAKQNFLVQPGVDQGLHVHNFHSHKKHNLISPVHNLTPALAEWPQRHVIMYNSIRLFLLLHILYTVRYCTCSEPLPPLCSRCTASARASCN